MKGIILFLLACFVMVHTELHELFTIPALITHYITHKKENPEQNILDFLSEHYNTEKHTHHASDEHKKLPFKHDKIVHSTYLSILQPFTLIFKHQVIVQKHNFILYSSNLPDLRLAEGIWQPPKM